ncbi:MAG: helix-turn-helix domain-containing protein [Proteobacteria bacterium]|nr:helix-turn-helix domain-containing protein [Pseudomonadota bacterium]
MRKSPNKSRVPASATPPIPDPLYDTLAASAYLGVRDRTLESWRFQGRGPVFHVIGRSIRYKLSDLNAYLNSGRVDPAAASAA